LDYVLHRNTSDNPIDDRWSEITQEDFDAFRVSPTYMAARLPALATVPNPGTTGVTRATAVISPTTTPAKVHTQAELFCRGIKKDPSLFPTLKDEKFHDNWHRSFVNQARAQDVSQVLDASYVATTDEEKELSLKNRSMYMLFLKQKFLLTEEKP
jgi:hypothetical protein